MRRLSRDAAPMCGDGTPTKNAMMNTRTARRGRRRMQRLAILFALLVSALTFTGGASAALRTGVADDLGRYPDQSVWFLDSLGELGMTENRISVGFDPAAPTTIPTSGSSISTSRSPLFAVFARSSRCPPRRRRRSPRIRTHRFSTRSTALLARRYPTVKDFIIGNEPNQPRFWQPQFASSGQNVSARSYYRLLAASYDSLKAVDPVIRVIGLGLTARRRPAGASNNVSTSPSVSSARSERRIGRAAGSGRSWTSSPTTRIRIATGTR